MPDDKLQRGTPPIVQYTNSPRRRTNVTKACMACRMRKSKCSGAEPCEGCRSMNIECVRKRLPDMRRKPSISKTASNHPQHSQTLQNLLYLLRTLEDDPLKQLLQAVRMNVPIFELAGYMSQVLAGAIIMPQNKHRFDAGPSRNGTTTSAEIARLPMNAPIHPGTSPTLLVGSDQPRMLPTQSELYKRSSGSKDRTAPLVSARVPANAEPTQELNSFGHVSAIHSEPLQPTVPHFLPSPTLDLTNVPEHQKTEHEEVWDESRTSLQGRDHGNDCDWPWLMPMALPAQDIGIVESLLSTSPDMSLHSGHKASSLWGKHAIMSQWRSNASFKVVVPDKAGNLAEHSTETRATAYMCRTERPGQTKAVDRPELPAGAPFQFRSSTNDCSPDTDPAVSFQNIHETRLSGAPIWAACTSMGYLALPRLQQDSSSTSQAITAYLGFARLSLSRGGPWIDVFGPDRPIVDLLFRPRQASDGHSVCNFVCELYASLSGLEPPARFGMAFMMVYLIRWMLLPTPENYNKIPLMYKPTIAQITMPHSIVVELCPLPQLRDALCRKARDFMRPLIDNISCSWPYGETLCIETLQGTSHVVLTDNFCLHAMSTENWVVRDALFDTFPECRGQIGVCA